MHVPSKESWEEASRLNELGRELANRDEDSEAIRYYTLAVEACEAFEPAWFNMGLVHKRRREWAECARCCERASKLDGSPGDPSWWNLGIAATALKDWPLARQAWSAFGVIVPPGEGELQMALGPVPIRVGGNSQEVVWCKRIDPARGVIANVPTPATGRSWRDIVLHDGTPNGERSLNGQSVPVFDELERWKPSGIPTTVYRLQVASEDDAHAVEALFDDDGLAAEDWTKNTRILCKQCSEGRPFEDHEHPIKDIAGERILGVAGEPDQVLQLLEQWKQGGVNRQFWLSDVP